MKRYIILLIAALLLVFSCRKEKSQSAQSPNNPPSHPPATYSITPISPIHNAYTSLTPTFKWSVNNLTGPYMLYLYYFNLQQNGPAVDSILTDSLSYTWTSSLNYGTSYTWAVRTGTFMSVIDSFTTIYPDSQVVGKYWVTVSAENSTPWDTVYGQCMLTISKISSGVLSLYSDSFATYPVTLPYYQGGGTEFLYGMIGSNLTVFNIYSDSITVNAFAGQSGNTLINGTSWIGRKVH